MATAQLFAAALKRLKRYFNKLRLETHVDPAGAGAKTKVRSKERMPSQGTGRENIGYRNYIAESA